MEGFDGEYSRSYARELNSYMTPSYYGRQTGRSTNMPTDVLKKRSKVASKKVADVTGFVKELGNALPVDRLLPR